MLDEKRENELWNQYSRILGMDEAGRGPICGPVCVAGVIFEPGYDNPEINDSKKLTEKKREKLAVQIMQDAREYWIIMIDEKTIDEYNIYRAVQRGMNAIAQKAQADYTLSDAMPLSEQFAHEALVHGDARSVSIAAASILAKVSRDHYMLELDALFPQYGLKSHKGYPTKKHLEALDRYGLQSFYRRSYRPVYERLARQETLDFDFDTTEN